MRPGEQPENLQSQREQAAARANDTFFLNEAEGAFIQMDAAISTLPPNLQVVGQAFKENIYGAVLALTLPYKIFLASRLMEVRKELEERQPGTDFNQYALVNPDLFPQASVQAVIRMGLFLDHNGTKHGAEELLRQGALLFWNAFEILARDMFAETLNLYPAMVRRVIEAEQTKKLFKSSDIRLFDYLTDDCLDVTDRMGTILDSRNNVDTVYKMKIVYDVLLPGATEVRRLLNTEDLRVLQERRHLIVHRRGIIDADYHARVPADGVVGQRVVIEPSDIT